MNYNYWVRVWLFIGVLMIFIQIVLGGITRLTGSGLSITEWEIITGTIPPLNNSDWIIEFDKYKATPQYSKINEGMSLKEFKVIYFWEYIHRLWARIMGFVFIIPFCVFLFKKWIDPPLIRKLLIVIALAVLVASLGWIMVASGLENRPWVNAYKLALHLTVAILLYAYLFRVWIWSGSETGWHIDGVKTLFKIFLILLIVQIFFGGVMSGMKAGLVHPTWPDISGEYFPQDIFQQSNWTVEKFNNYDRYSFLATLINFSHRFVAYVLVVLGIWIFMRIRKSAVEKRLRTYNYMFITMLISQVLLGIITILYCRGSIPVIWGVIHQGFAVVLLSGSLFMNSMIKKY